MATFQISCRPRMAVAHPQAVPLQRRLTRAAIFLKRADAHADVLQIERDHAVA